MKKSLSLLLALLMIISCVFVLASCKDKDDNSEKSEEASKETAGKYDGKYVYDTMDFSFLLNGEDMSELLGEDFFSIEDATGAFVEIKGNQMTFSGEEGEEPTVITVEEKDGKLLVGQKDLESLLGDMTEEFGESGDLEFYFKAEGNILTMYVSIKAEEEGQEIEVSITASFKKQ